MFESHEVREDDDEQEIVITRPEGRFVVTATNKRVKIVAPNGDEHGVDFYENTVYGYNRDAGSDREHTC